MNLLGSYNTAAYLVSGHWSRKALNEAKRYTNPVCVADAKNTDYRSIPDQSSWELPRSAAYLYCCDNETVHGLMLTRAPKLNLPVVCDMTSSLMTAPVDWGCYDLVFAGCQKNIAPAGMTVIVIRKDLLKRTPIKETPSIFNYEELIKNRSLLNTPATFSWYVASLVCQWVINQGGLEEMQRRCNLRSSLLYAYIDQSALYVNQVEKPFRSNINVCFNLRDERLMPEFLVGAEKEGLLSLKGHKAVGGLRASLYNAMPVAGVESLVAYMKNFESNYRCDK
jgi:phosphoserine aminotransferase